MDGVEGEVAIDPGNFVTVFCDYLLGGGVEAGAERTLKIRIFDEKDIGVAVAADMVVVGDFGDVVKRGSGGGGGTGASSTGSWGGGLCTDALFEILAFGVKVTNGARGED